MQVGNNSKVFEFCYIRKAAEAHILAMRRLLQPTGGLGDEVEGEAFFISDGRPQPFFDFARRCYAAVGSHVKEEEVTIIPLGVMQALASAGEWVYWICSFGMKKPGLRRDAIDHLGRGCCWDISKAKEKLGYVPVEDQDEVIRRSMEWGMANV